MVRACAWSIRLAVRNAPLFLVIDVDRGGSEALVRQASAVEREWLPADRLATRTEVEFDEASRRVIARRRVYWEDLLLEESPAALPDSEEVAAILAAAASESLDAVFPWDDAETAEFVNRVRCLAQWMPELELPALDSPGWRPFCPRYVEAAGRWTKFARPLGWRTCKPR